MPICSYVIHPEPGRFEELKHSLSTLDACTVIPADSLDLLVLVTDTTSDADEQRLQEQLHTTPHILCMSMACAAMDDAIPGVCS